VVAGHFAIDVDGRQPVDGTKVEQSAFLSEWGGKLLPVPHVPADEHVPDESLDGVGRRQGQTESISDNAPDVFPDAAETRLGGKGDHDRRVQLLAKRWRVSLMDVSGGGWGACLRMSWAMRRREECGGHPASDKPPHRVGLLKFPKAIEVLPAVVAHHLGASRK